MGLVISGTVVGTSGDTTIGSAKPKMGSEDITAAGDHSGTGDTSLSRRIVEALLSEE